MNAVKPTNKQLKTLEIKQANPKKTLGQAMVEAGYSKVTSSHPKQNFIDARGTEVALEQYKEKLAGLGITGNKMAEKMVEWIDAQKPIGAKILVAKDGTVIDADSQGAIEVPDYQTQIKAAEMLREDLGIKIKESKTNTNSVNIGTKEGNAIVFVNFKNGTES